LRGFRTAAVTGENQWVLHILNVCL